MTEWLAWPLRSIVRCFKHSGEQKHWNFFKKTIFQKNGAKFSFFWPSFNDASDQILRDQRKKPLFIYFLIYLLFYFSSQTLKFSPRSLRSGKQRGADWMNTSSREKKATGANLGVAVVDVEAVAVVVAVVAVVAAVAVVAFDWVSLFFVFAIFFPITGFSFSKSCALKLIGVVAYDTVGLFGTIEQNVPRLKVPL